MNSSIDHIVWYAEHLEQGIDTIETLLGVRAVAGGRHAGLGTHNALLSLGDRCYFEILAPDPTQSGGAWRDYLTQSVRSGLFHWAAAAPDLETLAESPSDEFLRHRPVVRASRESPTLGTLSWSLLFPGKHPFGALLPFLIDWGNSPHPSQVAPKGCRLKSIRIQAPETKRPDAFFKALGFNIEVEAAAEPRFSVVLDTPRGEVTLDSIKPLPEGLSLPDA